MKKIINMLKRKRYLRYSFFDAHNEPVWALAYLSLFWRDWRKKYAEQMSRYFNTPSFPIGSGRMGLYLLLRLFNIGKGDEVLLTGYTCVVCPNAVVYAGAKPVYVDIDPKTFSLDPDKMEEKITSRTRAVIIQHTYGLPASIEKTIEIARRHGLKVIEDCAHSIGIEYKGKKLGTFGDAAFFSSDHTKMISTELGGGIIINNIEQVSQMRQLIAELPLLKRSATIRLNFQYLLFGLLARPAVNWFGRYLFGLYHRLGLNFYFKDENISALDKIKDYPYPVQLSNFQAFAGCKEFERLDKNIRHRSEIVKGYEKIFNTNYGSVPMLMFPILVEKPQQWREKYEPYIELFDWFSRVIYGKSGSAEELNYFPGDCPVAEKTAAQVINFPTHFLINDKALELVKSIKEEII